MAWGASHAGADRGDMRRRTWQDMGVSSPEANYPGSTPARRFLDFACITDSIMQTQVSFRRFCRAPRSRSTRAPLDFHSHARKTRRRLKTRLSRDTHRKRVVRIANTEQHMLTTEEA